MIINPVVEVFQIHKQYASRGQLQ